MRKGTFLVMNSSERRLVIRAESFFFLNKRMLFSVIRNEERGGRLMDTLKSKSSHH